MPVGEGKSQKFSVPGESPWEAPLTRRQTLGLALLAVLARAGTAYAAPAATSAGLSAAKGEAFRVLQAEDAPLFAAIAGVILQHSLPANPQERALRIAEGVRGVDALIANLPPGVRGELRQVLDLLGFAPTRLLLTGAWRGWAESSSEQVTEALRNLSTSRFSLKRRIYQALHLLTGSSAFGAEWSWALVGYPGPPQVPRPSRPWTLP